MARAICERYGDPLHNIHPRISRTLHRAFTDASKPLTTHYGQCPPPRFRQPTVSLRCLPPFIAVLVTDIPTTL